VILRDTRRAAWPRLRWIRQAKCKVPQSARNSQLEEHVWISAECDSDHANAVLDGAPNSVDSAVSNVRAGSHAFEALTQKGRSDRGVDDCLRPVLEGIGNKNAIHRQACAKPSLVHLKTGLPERVSHRIPVDRYLAWVAEAKG
jgi:hypothetical protein